MTAALSRSAAIPSSHHLVRGAVGALLIGKDGGVITGFAEWRDSNARRVVPERAGWKAGRKGSERRGSVGQEPVGDSPNASPDLRGHGNSCQIWQHRRQGRRSPSHAQATAARDHTPALGLSPLSAEEMVRQPLTCRALPPSPDCLRASCSRLPLTRSAPIQSIGANHRGR